jgi:putative ABC transport system permease protein
VRHVFPGFGDPVSRVLIDVAAARSLDLQPVMDRLTLTLAPGSELAAELSRRFAGLEVQSRSGLRAVALRIFDRTFAVTQALTLLALFVAVVGMYSALMALRLIQAPTRRLLLHQGATGTELRVLALLRALALGALALGVALPLGLAMAWVLCAVINPRAFGWSVGLELPVSGLAPPLLLGLLAAVLAGLLPAPREQGDLDDAG